MERRGIESFLCRVNNETRQRQSIVFSFDTTISLKWVIIWRKGFNRKSVALRSFIYIIPTWIKSSTAAGGRDLWPHALCADFLGWAIY